MASVGRQLDTRGHREPELRNRLHQIVLWAMSVGHYQDN